MMAKPPIAFPGMRIGLLGGSFNPPHEGHLHISLAALKRLQLHQIWWVITPGNPLKSGQELVSLDDRLAAARAIATHPKIRVSGFEAALPSSYTIDTVRFLRKRYPAVRFIWVMGGDILTQLHRWRHWPRLFETLPLLILDRPATRHQAFASPAAIRFAASRLPENAAPSLLNHKSPVWSYLNLPLCELSSTAIRAERKSMKHMKAK